MKKDIKQLIKYLNKAELKNCCVKIFFNKNNEIIRISNEQSIKINDEDIKIEK